MNKTYAAMCVAIIVLLGVGCNPTDTKDAKEMTAPPSNPEPTTETTGISAEKALALDLTEQERIELTTLGLDDMTIDAWIEEQRAMGPGRSEFSADLEDVSGGTATGYAGAAFDEEYFLFAEFEGLPHPEDDFFYEGWVVRRNPLSVISTGPAERGLGVYTNHFTAETDILDHDFYVLTLEPDDGDPAPAAHILEGVMQ